MQLGTDFVRGWLQRLALFPFLLPVFFVFHVARYFYGTIPAGSVLLIAGIYLVVTTVLFFLIGKAVKKRLEQGLITAMLLGLLIYWMPIIHTIGGAFHLDGNYNYYPIILAIYFLAAFLVYRLLRRQSAKTKESLLYYLNSLFVLFVAVELGLMGYYALESLHKKPLMAMNAAERPIDFGAKAGANIYLLLFDEYASTVALSESWDFDNSATDSFLKAKGFHVNESSRANYCWTTFSMASLLHMNYFNGYRQTLNYYSPREAQECIAAIKNARVACILNGAGYVLKSYSLFSVADQPKQEIPGLMVGGEKLLTVNSFYTALVNDYLPYLAHRAAIRKDPAYRYPPFYRADDYNNAGIDTVIQAAKQTMLQPKFVYAHFMMPHNRYYYDSAGGVMPIDKINAITPDEDLKYYRYSIQHTNTKMRQMVDTILKADPRAAIIVLGDHGYRRRIDTADHPEYFRNMSAIYFPDGIYSSIPDSLTNVNVFRIVLNKVCGTHYPLLPNKCYKLLERVD